LAAKSLGALGTLGLGAISLNKFSDIFPLPQSPSIWQLLAVVLVTAALLAMAAAVALMTARLWRVSAPIFMSPQLESVQDDLADPDPANWKKTRRVLKGKGKSAAEKERERVAKIYGDTAALYDAESLEGYAARGLRLSGSLRTLKTPASERRRRPTRCVSATTSSPRRTKRRLTWSGCAPQTHF
jgi:hypothetical protein